MMRRVVIVSVGGAALIPAVTAASPVLGEDKGPSCPQPMRPSDLPVYESPHAEYAEYLEKQAKAGKKHYIKDALLKPISTVRQHAQVVWDHTGALKHTVQDSYSDLSDKSEWIFTYFREEDNKNVRYGAVAMGGVTGFIFGLRGGIIRRLLYSGIGTTGMGLICFPDDTKEVLENNSMFAKHYINIAYNFFYGVKPGDPQLELKFPELSFPKDFKEFSDMTMSLGCTIYRAIMPPPSPAKEDTKPPDNKE